MKLIDIIKYFDFMSNIKVVQTDAYREGSEHYGEEEELYNGDVWNIPWWVVDMYLDNDDSGCGSIGMDKENNSFIVYVKEDISLGGGEKT